jgi:hypothetical protein
VVRNSHGSITTTILTFRMAGNVVVDIWISIKEAIRDSERRICCLSN